MKNSIKSILLLGSISHSLGATTTSESGSFAGYDGAKTTAIPADHTLECTYQGSTSTLITERGTAGKITLSATQTIATHLYDQDTAGALVGGTENWKCLYKDSAGQAQALSAGGGYELTASATHDECASPTVVVATVPGNLELSPGSYYPTVTVGITTTATFADCEPSKDYSAAVTYDLFAAAKASVHKPAPATVESLQATSALVRDASNPKVFNKVDTPTFQLGVATPPAPSASSSYFDGTLCSAGGTGHLCQGGIKATVSGVEHSGQGVNLWCDAAGTNTKCQQMQMDDTLTTCVQHETPQYISTSSNLLDLLECSPSRHVYDFNDATIPCLGGDFAMSSIDIANHGDRCFQIVSALAPISPGSCDPTDADGGEETVFEYPAGTTKYTFVRDSAFFGELPGTGASGTNPTPTLTPVVAGSPFSITNNAVDGVRKYDVVLSGTRVGITRLVLEGCESAAMELAITATKILCPYPDANALAALDYGTAATSKSLALKALWEKNTNRCPLHADNTDQLLDDTPLGTMTVQFDQNVRKSVNVDIQLVCATKHGHTQLLYPWSGTTTITLGNGASSKKCSGSSTSAGFYNAGECTANDGTVTVAQNEIVYINPSDYSCGNRNQGSIGGYIIVTENSESRHVGIKCPTSACPVIVDGMKLDYNIDFEVENANPKLVTSIENSDIDIGTRGGGACAANGDCELNLCDASSICSYSADYATVTRQGVITSQNECGANGQLSATPANGQTATAGNIDMSTAYANDLQQFIDDLNSKSGGQAGSPNAVVYVSQSVSVSYATGQSNLEFCQAIKLQIAISEKKGQLSSALTVEEYEDYNFEASFQQLAWEPCGSGNFQVVVDIDLNPQTPITASQFAPSYTSPLSFSHSVSSGGVIHYESQCFDVCGPAAAAYMAGTHSITTQFVPGNSDGRSLNTQFTVDTQLKGAPVDCEGVRDTENKLSLVELRHYLKDGANGCDASPATNSPSVIQAGTDTVCFEVYAPEEFQLSVDAVTTVLTDAAGVVLTGFAETPIQTRVGNPSDVGSNPRHHTGSFAPVNGHQGGTYTVIVDFSQPISTRRLRAVYNFGVGEGHKEDSVKILPAEVQVQEQLEAPDAEEAPETPDAPAEHEGTSGSTTIENTTIYVGIALIVTGAAVWILTMTKCCHDRLHCCGGMQGASMGERSSKGYKKVDNFERFKSNIAF